LLPPFVVETPKLSIVIPAYNEEARIAATVEQILAWLRQTEWRPFEIIVVDDGSTDSTSAVISGISAAHQEVRLISRRENRGKGYSVREGALAGKGEYLLFSDADLSTPIEEVEKLARWLKMGYDIAIGSRGLAESRIEVRQPWMRQKAGQVFNLMVRLLGVWGFRDTQCGFKLFSRGAAESVFAGQTIDGFAFDVELLTIARKQGLRIREVPVVWRHAGPSKVHMLSDSLKMFSDLVRVRARALLGLYKSS
jgi:dolichyl-phosphate beta-glucosyltransferase